MQYLSGKIKNIFSKHWDSFKQKYPRLVTPHIDNIVSKSLACRTEKLGCHIAPCKYCDRLKIIRHSCKTRFCSSCGSVYNDRWLSKILNIIWNLPHHHLTFTIPSSLYPLVKLNPALINAFFTSAYQSIKIFGEKHKLIIPAFFVLQTFGSRLNYHPHLHGAIPAYVPALNLKELEELYLEIHAISKTFAALFVRKIRKLFKNHKLILPNDSYLKNYSQFNKYLDQLVNWCFKPNNPKSWCVYLSKRTEFDPLPVSYIGRYLKTPPVSEAKIQFFTRKKVVFWVKDYQLKNDDFYSINYGYYHKLYLKKYRQKRVTLYQLSINDFISSVIQHIPAKGLKIVRLYGPYANSVHKKFFEQVKHLLPKTALPAGRQEKSSSDLALSWRQRRIKQSGSDPLICSYCKREMQIEEILYPDDSFLEKYSFKQLQNLKFTTYQKLREKFLNDYFDSS